MASLINISQFFIVAGAGAVSSTVVGSENMFDCSTGLGDEWQESE